MRKERLFIETVSIFLEGDAFYEERCERKVFDKTLSISERTTSFRNGSYSVSIKEGKVVKRERERERERERFFKSFPNELVFFIFYLRNIFECRKIWNISDVEYGSMNDNAITGNAS